MSGHDRATRLSSGPVPSGAPSERQVGEQQEGPAHLLVGRLGRGVERSFLFAEGAAARRQGVGGRRLARLAGGADLLGERLHLCPQLVAPSDRGAGGLVQHQQPVDLRRFDPPALERGLHRATVLTHQPDVDHDGPNGSVTTREPAPSSQARSGGETAADGDRAAEPGVGPGTEPATGPDTEPAVVCTGAVIRYGDRVAVDGLSFTAHRGRVLALLGPNGAGKTSTIEALEGYRRLDDGRVAVLGLDPRRDHAALVPRLGVMLQRGGVYPSLERPTRWWASSPATTGEPRTPTG